jgi:uncharacterized short protein YbdD (DUF466 family)
MSGTQSGHKFMLRQALADGWSLLRRLSGDDAFDRYLDHFTRAHPSGSPLTRSEFECRRQELKWGRISRCC